MSKLRQSYWFVQGFTSKYKKTVLVSFLSVIGLMLILLVLLPKLPRPTKHTYIGIVGKYTLAQIPSEIETRLGMGLTRIGENRAPEPGLASRWEIEDEGRLYRFYLRDNLRWSNGQPLLLMDLEFIIPNVEVTKKEPNIIEFKLPEPFAPFPSVLSRPVVKNGTLTSGEFTIVDIKVNGPYIEQVELESTNSKLSYRFFDTTSKALLAFRLGQIDELGELLSRPEEADWPNVMIEELPRTDLFVAMFYNNADTLLADKSLRQGLSYAIADKQFNQLRAISPYDPSSFVYNKTVKSYEYSEARARELISKAGGGQTELSIELSTTPELLAVAEKIKLDWEKVGVKVEIKVVSSVASNFQAVVRTLSIPSDPDQYAYWHSTQATNFTHFQNAKVDKLLEDGRQTLRQDERRLIYQDLQRFLVEEAPASFLYHPTTYRIKRK